ncbi:hypothetical protein [Paraburkholderia sp. J67]|uniref:hypothetical protein n=1 Tax=Paraburkholderia sp. J67 TaxID=2805435 RepID=UPI002ABD6D43|nr:hypothetical protein [Paraburkholderia sp. J67]
MAPVDALPIDNRIEMVIGRQTRTVHDSALFRLADYSPSSGDGWVVAAVEPAPGSGASYVPGAKIDGATGEYVEPAGSQPMVRMKGAWRVIEAADASLPPSTPYDWSKPLQHRVSVKEPDSGYPLFKAGGTAVFEWEPGAQGEQQFGAVRMIFPEWARDAAQLLQSAATTDAAIAALEKAGPASAQADALLASPNGLTATIALRTLLHSDSPQALVARMPALLRDSDARRLGVFVYSCLMESDPAIRELLVPVIRSEIESTTDANRLGPIAYAAYAASNDGRFDPDKRQAAIDIVTDVQRRSAALHVPVNATAPWTLIFEWLGVLPPHTFVR